MLPAMCHSEYSSGSLTSTRIGFCLPSSNFDFSSLAVMSSSWAVSSAHVQADMPLSNKWHPVLRFS